MKKHPAHSLHVVSLLAAGMTLGAAPVFSAALGAIQVRSTLGERFDAVIQVSTSAGEELSNSCFKVGTPVQDDGSVVLHGVQVTWEPQGDRTGRLRLRTSEPVTEPVVQLPMQVKCGSDDTREFQRDYTLLLDPRDYRGAMTASPELPGAKTPARTTQTRPTQRKLPAPGGTWTAHAGDSVESIVNRFYPRDGAARRQFINDLYAQNPDLPQGFRVPLPVDTEVTLPGKPAVQTSEPATRPAKFARKSGEASGRAVLRLDDSAPETPSPSTAPSPGAAAVASQAASEDQQLAALKAQIAQLQQELAQLKTQAQQQLVPPAPVPATQPAPANSNAAPAATGRPSAPVHMATPAAEKSSSWLDWLLIPAALLALAIAVAMVFKRWKARQRNPQAAEAEYAMRFADGVPDDTDEESVFAPAAGAAARGTPAPAPARAPQPPRELASHGNQIANEWQNATMDVVQPGNVSEEAQLLLDHGLLQQAINLLIQEIEQHPTVAVLWLKLLSIYSQHQMKSEFLDYAKQFREQFSDEGLWRQVQVMGADVDPDNPLYHLSAEEAASLPDYRKESALKQSIGGTLPDHPSAPSLEADAAFASLMREQAGLNAESDWTLSEDHEALPRKALAQHVPFDTRTPDPLQPVQETDQPAGFFGNEMEFDLDALPPLETPVIPEPVAQPAPQPAPPAQPAADKPEPSEFRSDDPQMQKIAALLEHGQAGEAMRALEETLYSGSGSQRQLALKWLGKLQPRAFDK